MAHSIVRLAFGAAAAVLLVPASGRADWPVPRHDPARTGAATGVSNLRSPAAYWRSYLGGRVTSTQSLPLGDAGGGAAVVRGGRVAATDFDGGLRWQSDNLALTSLVGLADLDGDGGRELIARSTSRVYVLDPSDGAVLWSEPAGEMGTISGVLASDVDGDGRADLVIQECSCCQVRGPVPGVAYGFADGMNAPRALWQMSESACGGARALLTADVDGEGTTDLVSTTQDQVRILSGATGAVLAASPDLGTWVSLSYCEAVQLDASPGLELVCALGSSLPDPGTGHRVYALGYRPGPARLDVLWSVDVGDTDGDLTLGAGWIRDLDGDGQLEVVATGQASGAPVTVVLDAATGATLATIADERVVGTVELAAADVRLVTQADHQLSTWRFARADDPRLTPSLRVADRRAVVVRDWSRSPVQPLAGQLLARDVDGDGHRDLFTIDSERPRELIVYDGASQVPATLRTWAARPGAEILTAWLDGDRLEVSSSDGRLTSLSDDLAAEHGSTRVGGYYDAGAWRHLPYAPVAAQLTGDAAAEVLMADSRRVVVALDARAATNAAPPSVLWQIDDAVAPSIVPGLDGGAPGVACRRFEHDVPAPLDTVAAFGADGSPRWETPVGPTAWNDVMPGNFDGDAVPDLVVQWTASTDLALVTTALSGATGQVLWSTPIVAGGTRFPSGLAVSDWDGDGRDDVIFQHYGVRVLSGVDGAQIAGGGTANIAYFMPTVADVDGDGDDEISLHGGQFPARTLDHDLTTPLWTSTDNDRPYPYAALATCPSGAVLVGGSLLNPSRLKVTTQAGATAGQVASAVLAGGQLFADAAAADAAGAVQGQLTSVTVHADLTGDGRPSAVVGSSDGWLYAVDPCALTLDFAVPFGSPVGSVAFADTDGDGLDELLVSVADGFLYGLRHAPLAGPGEVIDVDPATGALVDVDEVVTRDTLSAAWDPVPGADGYEAAVALAEGGYISNPAWTAVDGTTFTWTGLPLTDGTRYVVSVRARSSAGVSPDILSDGVRVRFEDGPADAGPDAGPIGVPTGGCCSTGPGGPSPAGPIGLALAVAAILFGRIRRRGRAR